MTMVKQPLSFGGAGRRGALAAALVLGAPFVLLVPGLAGEPAGIALAGALLGLLGLVQTPAARALREKRLETAALIAFCLALCLLLYGGWLEAQWSIIDDHELFFYLDGRSRLGFLEALRAFAGHYEVGGVAANSLARFRPGYYLVRFAGLWLFGGEAAWWNRLDFALLALSLCLAALALRRFLGLAGALLATVACLSLPFWPGMLFSNLQQESVALLGLCLCAHGLTRAFGAQAASLPGGPEPGPPAWAWVEACGGAVLAMALKENFLLLAPILPCAALLAKRRGALPGKAALCVAAALAYAALAVAVLAVLLARQGADMYANPVSAASRLPFLLPGLARFADLAALAWTLPGLAPFLALGLHANRRDRYPSLRRDLARTALALTACAFAFVSQYAFYNGQIPLGGHRYDFPALLAPPGAGLALAWLAARCLRHSGPRPLRRSAPVLLCAALAAFAAAHGFDDWRSQLRLALDKTQIFEARLGAVALLAKAEPNRPLVLFARNPDSIEAVDSVIVFLRKRFGVANPIFLDYQGPPSLAPDQIHLRNLDAELTRLSQNGSAELTPLCQLPAGGEPLGLGFDGPPGAGSRNLGRIWPLP